MKYTKTKRMPNTDFECRIYTEIKYIKVTDNKRMKIH